MRVVNANYEETGGGIITYYGSLDNGKYFVFGNNTLLFCDADYGEVFTEEFFEQTDGDISEWEQEHVLRSFEYPSSKAPEEIVVDAFKVLANRYPGKRNWYDLCRKELGIQRGN